MVLPQARSFVAILLIFGATALSVTGLGCIGPDPNLQGFAEPEDDPENQDFNTEPLARAPNEAAPAPPNPPVLAPAAQPIRVQAVAAPQPAGPPRELMDWHDNFTVLWKTTLGDGGAVLPLVARSQRQVPRAEMFSRVLGVYFPPESDEIIFLGTFDPARPPLDPTELLDGLAVAYRTWWQSGQQAVSIDPPADQAAKIAQNPDAKIEPHQVRFFGGIGETAVGFAAFEADRLMKCLSLGADNDKDGTPFSCNVPGYQNKFVLLRTFPGDSGSQHRFWFEPNNPRAAASNDRRLVIAQSPQRVQTKEEKSGVDVQADRASQAFADHLTQHFDAYAADPRLHEFARMQAFSVLFAIAGKLHGEPADRTVAKELDNPARNPNVPAWLTGGHDVASVTSPATTPAIRRTEPGPAGSQITLMLFGGVRLDANRPAPWDVALAEMVQRELRNQMTAQPASRVWRWTMGSQTVGAVRVGHVAQRFAWHNDLGNPQLQLVRETIAADAPSGEFGRGWKLRMPRIHFSDERITTTDDISWPAYAKVENGAGKTYLLAQQSETTFADGSKAITFLSRDGRRGAMVMNKQQLIYFEGSLEFFDNNSVAPRGEGSQLIFFQHTTSATVNPLTSDAKYQVERIHAADGSYVTYFYDNARLKSISAPQQPHIQFSYQDGRISRAELSDKSAVRHYRYGAWGELTHVFGAAQDRLGYSYGEQSLEFNALGARLSATTTATAQLEIEQQNIRSEIRSPTKELQHVAIVAINNEKTPYRFVVDGQERASAGFSQLGNRQGGARKDLERQFKAPLEELLNKTAEVLVVSGDFAERHQFTEIVSIVDPQRLTVATHDPEVAMEKLRRDGQRLENGRTQVIFDKRWVSEDAKEEDTGGSVPESLLALADKFNDPTAKVVILPGHLDEAYETALKKLRESGALANKCVVMLTCASPTRTHDVAFVQTLVRDGGAATVSRSPRKLDQRKLPSIIRRINANLQHLGSQPTHAEILRAISAAMEGQGSGELYHQAHTLPSRHESNSSVLRGHG